MTTTLLDKPAEAEATYALPQPVSRRSTRVAWVSLAVVMVAGVPLFLCLPLWFDVTHYDLCARKLLRGGMLYRDAVDNNLPGIIWLQAGIRALFGWRSEVLRLADLLFFSLTVSLLLRWLPSRDNSPGLSVWTTVAIYNFYLFTPENCHCQRDGWMLLPALAALAMRQRQVDRLVRLEGSWSAMGWAVLEGLCWGAAFWIKPYVAVPGLFCWLVGVASVRRARAGAGRLLIVDTLGLLTGGLAAGALGLAWLWESGVWPHFWNFLLGWNAEYLVFSRSLPLRLSRLLMWSIDSLPWSILPWVTMPIALVTLKRGLTAPALRAGSDSRSLTPPTLLAGFYLGWLFQAVCLQLPHDYVLMPTVILALPVLVSAFPWLSPALLRVLAVPAAVGLLVLWVPNIHLERLGAWGQCWREGSTPEVRDRLVLHRGVDQADWRGLAEVAAYLRSQGIKDGELTCMTGYTHPLYLELDVEPATWIDQVHMPAVFFPAHRGELRSALAASHQRFVISDLEWTGLTPDQVNQNGPEQPPGLPADFPRQFLDVYPWSEPVAFRSGRYVVHRATGPVGRLCLDDVIDKSAGSR